MANNLIEAAAKGDVRQVDILIKEGAPVNWQTRDERTPLVAAAAGGHTDVVRLLLDHGSDPTLPTWHQQATPLHMASLNGWPDIVVILIDAGAVVNAPDHQGQTPLHYAVRHGRSEAVEILLANTADPTIKDRHDDDAIDIAREHGRDSILHMMNHRDR